MAPPGTPRIELVGIEKRFGAQVVLRSANLCALAGELVGLCGDSGAGKSTMVRILAGVHAHGSYGGRILLDGEELRFASPAEATRAGIAVLHQSSTLTPQLTVAENLMLGCEPRHFGLVDAARLEAEARAHLERHGFAGEISPSATVGELPAGPRQFVEILRALARGARLLVLDEPAAALQPSERERLFAWLRRLCAEGATCVYATHRVEELIGLCDRITVLRGGTTAETCRVSPPSRRQVGGRYLVHDEIAAGGMATVHLGKIRGPYGFSSTVAIKRLHPLLARDPDFVAMFLDEARLASRVRHANVVTVLDVLAEDGELCLVMEYVEGESLWRLAHEANAANAPVPVAVAVAVVAGVLCGLHAAHEATDERGTPLGLVHRDVSPHNVIVGVDGVPRVIDFGVAKAAGRRSVSGSRQLKGKIAYMAPEQIRGGVVDRRTDVYGASVLLWELLCGERLFDGDSEGMVLGRVLDERVPRPSTLRADLPAALDAITLRGLERAPERRFESALAMARDLEAAVRPAALEAIGGWVQALAGEGLATRREILARLERQALAEADDP
jgi:serine/threonine-protein kinase